MKKVLAIFAATMMLAGVASSCSKLCECTQTIGSSSVQYEVNLEDTDYSRCNQMNSENTVLGVTTTVKCVRK